MRASVLCGDEHESNSQDKLHGARSARVRSQGVGHGWTGESHVRLSVTFHSGLSLNVLIAHVVAVILVVSLHSMHFVVLAKQHVHVRFYY